MLLTILQYTAQPPSPTTKNDVAPNVNHIQFEKLWARALVALPQSNSKPMKHLSFRSVQNELL